MEDVSVKKDKQIAAISLSVYDFLQNNKCISVPRYQREYSWEKENINIFLNDIHENYYLGNIILYKDSDVSEVIDGQQRIITTFLILISIRNITEDGKLKENINKIIYNANDCKLIIKDRIDSAGGNILNYILEDDDEKIPETVRNYNEIQKYKYIKKILKDMDLNEIYYNLIHSSVVEISFNKNISDAHEMFVNVNTKGKALTEIEILKSQLFKYLLAKPNTDIYKEKWQEMLNNIPKKEYSTFVSDTYLEHVFINSSPEDKIKTNGTVKENFHMLMDLIDSEDKASEIFNLMTGNELINIYYPYYAIKTHNLEILKDNYYSNLNTSLSGISSLWKLFEDFGFEQSDILFVSLFRNKETFVKNHINFLYNFMLYIFLYEISRSIIGTSPAQYANSFRQLAREVSNETDPSKIKKILREYILKRTIDTEDLKRKLCEQNRFSKNYKTAKFIIMLVDCNYTNGLTVEHFIHQKTEDEEEKKYVSYLGNLIPVTKDKYKNKSIKDKLTIYKDDALSNISINKFLEFGITENNYQTKIINRTNKIADDFVKLIADCYDILIKR